VDRPLDDQKGPGQSTNDVLFLYMLRHHTATIMSSKKAANGAVAGEAFPVPEPLFTRLIVAPVLFVSFLISLFLIDRKVYGGIFGSAGSKDGYYHSHQRKLAKQEIDDAFQLRKRVIAAMCVIGGVGVALVAWSIEKAWTRWRVRAS